MIFIQNLHKETFIRRFLYTIFRMNPSKIIKMRTLKPLSIIYNQKSGFHASKHEDMYEQLMTVFTEFGFEIQVFELAEDVSFDDLMSQVIHRHSQKCKLRCCCCSGWGWNIKCGSIKT